MFLYYLFKKKILTLYLATTLDLSERVSLPFNLGHHIHVGQYLNFFYTSNNILLKFLY